MRVAKVLLIDNDNQYLLLTRNAHPYLHDDPDLPGGIVEKGETTLLAVVREAEEELGVLLPADSLELLYEGSKYSLHNTRKSLYIAHVNPRPKAVISWEHKSYTWLPREEFLAQVKTAKDTYMHMVYDVVSGLGKI